MLLSAAITLVLARRIVRPLRDAAAVADRIAGGELETPIPQGGPDETGTLLRSMTVMQDSIRVMVEREKSQRRSAQTRLAEALENSREGIILVGADGKVLLGHMPNYAQIVPNQCNDMHGRIDGADVPPDCRKSNVPGLITRGDRVIAGLVRSIMDSPVWREAANTAIVITFDENDNDEFHGADEGCCGTEPQSPANFGGGHIPTIVITNHGPRGVTDDRPYNHYALLRTTEAAFGIEEYLGHAADEYSGVVSMLPLFAVKH